MPHLNKASLIVVGGLVLIAGLFAPAASAAAPCPDGAICFYKDAHFRGSVSTQSTLIDGTPSISNFANSTFHDGSSLDNKISSVVNNSRYCLKLFPVKGWKEKDGSRSYFSIVSPGGTDDFTGSEGAFADRMSSAYTYGVSGFECRDDQLAARGERLSLSNAINVRF